MKSIVVIDNFYENPDAVRRYALNNVEYIDSKRLSPEFPGTESKQSFFSQRVVEKIEHAIGQKIKAEPEKYSFGVFAKAYAKDERRKVVHVDSSDWTGLIYLSEPVAEKRSGTVFYRHRKTGLDSIPEDSQVEFTERVLKPQGADESCWEISARVAMKFNRMVLFQAGRLFHAAEGYFGTSDETCRLIQLFFFKTEERA